MPPELPTTLAGSAPWLLVSAAFVKTGGQDRANFALASYLARHSHDVHLVAHRTGGDIGPTANIVCHAAPRPLQSDLLGEPFLQWLGSYWARRLRTCHPRVVVNGGNCDWPDVNWVHYVHAAYRAPPAPSLSRRVQHALSHRLSLEQERAALSKARLIIANSERTRRDLTERLGADDGRIRTVYYRIDGRRWLSSAR